MASQCEVLVKDGDAPIGDGSGTDYAIVKCPGVQDLGFRFRYDREIAKFHISGFWTLR